MFKATTRRVKGDISAKLAGVKYESFIHEAHPMAVAAEDGAGFLVLTPVVRGGAMAYGSMTGGFSTQAEALERGRAAMLADGWRESREQAEQDAADEIERRTQYRADGKARFKA